MSATQDRQHVSVWLTPEAQQAVQREVERLSAAMRIEVSRTDAIHSLLLRGDEAIRGQADGGAAA